MFHVNKNTFPHLANYEKTIFRKFLESAEKRQST